MAKLTYDAVVTIGIQFEHKIVNEGRALETHVNLKKQKRFIRRLIRLCKKFGYGAEVVRDDL